MVDDREDQGVTRRRKRNPLLWVVMIALVVALGLGSRRFGRSLPGFVAAYAGDTLWALVASSNRHFRSRS